MIYPNECREYHAYNQNLKISNGVCLKSSACEWFEKYKSSGYGVNNVAFLRVKLSFQVHFCIIILIFRQFQRFEDRM